MGRDEIGDELGRVSQRASAALFDLGRRRVLRTLLGALISHPYWSM